MPQPVDPSDLPHGTAQEPATPPATQPHDAPAGDDGHPGIPDGPAVLGRALLDQANDLWVETGPDAYQAPAADDSWPRREIEQTFGPVREVLLVRPEVGRVLEAARAWVDIPPIGDEDLMAEREAVVRDLIAAVDALDRPTTGGPDHDGLTGQPLQTGGIVQGPPLRLDTGCVIPPDSVEIVLRGDLGQEGDRG